MLIHILHDKKIFTAKVVYNFRQLSNTILLRLDQPITDNQREIILSYQNTEWNDDASIKEQLPDVFSQILFKLRNVTREALRPTHLSS